MKSQHPRENTDATEGLTAQQVPSTAFAGSPAHESQSVQGKCKCDECEDRTCQYCGELDCRSCSEDNDTRGLMHEGFNANNRGPL